jgi:hypothetical protein
MGYFPPALEKVGSLKSSDVVIERYVRRALYKTKRRKGANSVFWGETRGPKSKSCVEMFNSIAGFWTFLVLSRTGETNESALRSS